MLFKLNRKISWSYSLFKSMFEKLEKWENMTRPWTCTHLISLCLNACLHQAVRMLSCIYIKQTHTLHTYIHTHTHAQNIWLPWSSHTFPVDIYVLRGSARKSCCKTSSCNTPFLLKEKTTKWPYWKNLACTHAHSP